MNDYTLLIKIKRKVIVMVTKKTKMFLNIEQFRSILITFIIV